MNIYAKIEALMPLFNLKTLEEVAAAIRKQGATTVKYQHLQQLRAFPARQPRYLLEMARVFGMTIEEFLAWHPGKPLPKQSEPLPPVAVSEPSSDYGWADVRGFPQEVGLGDGKEGEEYSETHKLKFRAKSLRRKRLHPDALAVVYGRGDSMLPRIRDGDAILFDTSDTTPRDGKLYIVHSQGPRGPEYSAKRCNEIDGIIYFEAINPDGDHTWKKPRRIDDKRKPITVAGRIRWIGSWED